MSIIHQPGTLLSQALHHQMHRIGVLGQLLLYIPTMHLQKSFYSTTWKVLILFPISAIFLLRFLCYFSFVLDFMAGRPWVKVSELTGHDHVLKVLVERMMVTATCFR